jgi:hypothetical protein
MIGREGMERELDGLRFIAHDLLIVKIPKYF